MHGFSPSEVDFFATRFRMDARDVIRELKAAGPRLDPGRRRRDPRAARARLRREEEGGRGSLARDHGDRAPGGHEDVRHDDVRHRRDARGAHRAPAARARRAGATGGFTAFICWPLQPENTPSMSHMPKTDAMDVPAHGRDRAHRARQRAEPAVELGHDGHEGRADGAALRLQRLRLAHDRGERRLGREHHVPHDDRRDGAADPRRRASRRRDAARTTRIIAPPRPRLAAA